MSELTPTRPEPDSQLYVEVARLARAFPNKPLSTGTLSLYADELYGIPTRLLGEAVTELIRTSEWFPTVAAIRRTCAEIALQLPSEAEAAEQIEAFSRWTHSRDSEEAPDVHPLVTRAIHRVGGYGAYRASQRPDAWRADFARAYRELRAAAIREAQVG